MVSTTTKKKAAASTTAKDEIFLLPLNLLVPSPNNVRKIGGQSIEELANSIRAEGLLQNLTVTAQVDTKGKETGRYEVTAGQRRLQALQLLVKGKTIAADHDTPCKIVSAERAISSSLAENQMRVAMHPADQFVAFKRMVDGGRSIAETAAAFTVSERIVRQRLKLAAVHPQLLDMYRDDKLCFEAISAYATCDDQELQLKVYEQLSHWQRDREDEILSLLSDEKISSTHPHVKFVGLEEYKKAGGTTSEDLFSEEEGVFTINDPTILNKLVNEKLGKTASKTKKEGFGWVEIKPSFGYHDKREYQELPRIQIREATEEQTQRLNELAAALTIAQAELDAIESEDIDPDADEDDDTYQERWRAADKKLDAIREEADEIRESLLGYAPEQLATAGAVVTIENGKAKVVRNLVKPTDVKAAIASCKQAQEASGVTPITTAHADKETNASDKAQENGEATLSGSMHLRLLAQKSAALQAELCSQPAIALATITAQLMHSVLMPVGHYLRPSHISTDMPNLTKDDKEIESSKAWQELSVQREKMATAIPAGTLDDFGRLICWLIAQGESRCTEYLAISLAHLVTARDPRNSNPLVNILQLDMRTWWTADRASFFDAVPKAISAAATAEALGIDEVMASTIKRQFDPLKKAAAAELAETKLAGTNWLPAPLRTPTSHP